MEDLTELNDLLSSPPTLRQRLMNNGYLFFRDILPKEKVYTSRRKIMGFCQDASWLRSNSDPMEGLTDREPILEGEAEWRPVYYLLN